MHYSINPVRLSKIVSKALAGSGFPECNGDEVLETLHVLQVLEHCITWFQNMNTAVYRIQDTSKRQYVHWRLTRISPRYVQHELG